MQKTQLFDLGRKVALVTGRRVASVEALAKLLAHKRSRD